MKRRRVKRSMIETLTQQNTELLGTLQLGNKQ